MRSVWAIKRAGRQWVSGSGCVWLPPSALADFSIPGYELVYTAPVETALQAPDLRAPDAVWSVLFDEAQHSLSLGEFYVANQSGSRLDNVLQHLRSAGERGVRIRFLLEEKGIALSTPETLAQLKAIPNLELRVIPYGKLTGWILHAKYLLVDGKRAYVGSQNFDWRSLEHIHETGLLIDDPSVVNSSMRCLSRTGRRSKHWRKVSPSSQLCRLLSRMIRARITIWLPAPKRSTHRACWILKRNCHAYWRKRKPACAFR